MHKTSHHIQLWTQAASSEGPRKKCAALFGGSLGVPVQQFLPEWKARRPKYCKNDSFCGSSGLLGIRKCHKSQERDCLCRILSPRFRLQRFKCILLCSRKTSKLLDTTLHWAQTLHLSGFDHHSSYQECHLIHNLQLFLTHSSALLKLSVFWQISQSTLETVLVS